MLIAPAIGLLLYSLFIAYSHNEHKDINRTIEDIQSSYLPALEIANENTLLLSKMTEQFKEAVFAGEMTWIDRTIKDKKKIENNLQGLNGYIGPLFFDSINKAESDFQQYYENAYALSKDMLINAANANERNILTENAAHYTDDSVKQFALLKVQIQEVFSQQIRETNEKLHGLTIIGIVVGVILFTVIVSVTLILTISTRRSLCEVINPLKEIATGNPDFTKRLTQRSHDEMGDLVLWFNLLLDKLEKDHKKIELLSITDKLTQIYNRSKIDDLLLSELQTVERYGGELSILLIDVDYFKEVNDQHGHLVGDVILQDLAKVFKDNIRKTDHVGRWGGEEFIIVSPRNTLEQATIQAKKIRKIIADYDFPTVGHITASFGIASYQPGDDSVSLWRRVDTCLYRAKEHGRNQVVNDTDAELS